MTTEPTPERLAQGRAMIEQWKACFTQTHETTRSYDASYGEKADTLQCVLDTLDAQAARTTALQYAAAECANDLESELKDRYHFPDVHPALQRKYDADMSTVRDVRAAIDAALQATPEA